MGPGHHGLPRREPFTLPPGPERDQQVASLKRWIDVCAELGAAAIRIFAGSAPAGSMRPRPGSGPSSHRGVLRHRAKRGVFLAVENHGGVVSTAEGLLEIVRAVRCEWVGINLDTGNFHSADPYAELERCVPYSVTCQLKTEIQPAGSKRQEVDIPGIVSMLRKEELRGYLTLEYEGEEEPLTAVPRYLAAMRAAL